MRDNVTELDESFLSNLNAVLYKRACNYKRNKKAIVTEVVLPALIMFIGVYLSRLSYLEQSPSRM